MATDLFCQCKNEKHRDMINKYFYKHLETQQSQRDSMDRTIEECKKLDEKGQPLKAFVLSDAITKYCGETPIIKSTTGNDRKSKQDDNKPMIGDRMFGSLVVCGPVKAYLLFHCHDFVGGGANCGIEILRLSLLKLAEILAEHEMNLPFHLACQFDNCGENKNKFMFGYLSLLIEIGVFSTINVSFLIVGHTHCIIDQWFSSVTKILGGVVFVGTPYAIEELLKMDRPKSKFARPQKQHHVHAIYDVVKALRPYINSEIKWYQVC